MRKWLGRVGNVVRPARMDRDLERELRFHVAERIDELQESGMSEDSAARLARQPSPPSDGRGSAVQPPLRKSTRPLMLTTAEVTVSVQQKT